MQGMSPFLIGVFLGLTITISIGPGFMALFQTSLVRGLRAGFVLATGMLLSDLTLVGVSCFGFAELTMKGDYRLMGVVAGIILIVMGIVSMIRKPDFSHETKIQVGIQGSPGIILIKGYLLNIVNPFSLIFWAGIAGFASKTWGLQSLNVWFFFTGVFMTAFSTDLMKCYLSNRLRILLVSSAVHWINRAMGLIFIGVGLFIMYKVTRY